MRISQRLSRLKPSATLTINAKAQELRAAGREIVSLAVGETDFPTPKHVCDAAKKAIDENFTRYTPAPGIPDLRKAVAGYFNQFYNADAKMEQTIVTNGGKQSLYGLLQALVDPGDEVLLPAPYWVSYPAMIQLAEGRTVPVPASAEKDFKITPEDLDRAATDRTRVLVFNTPSNPTGCHYTQAELDQIGQWAVDRGVFVISDEIYDRLVYPPAETASFCPWFRKAPELFAIVNGLAKCFAMTGWRVGYTLAHEDLVKAMTRLQGQSTSNICSIAQKAALAALTGPWDLVEEMKKSFVRRRDLALEIITSWPDVICPRPDGAFYVFPDLSAYMTGKASGSTELCALMLDQAGVALVPGAAFGDDACIRFSYAVADDVLSAALEKVGRVLAKVKKGV